MNAKHIKYYIAAVVIAASTIGHNAAAVLTQEGFSNAQAINGLVFWSVDPSDMAFSEAASTFGSLSGWVLDRTPFSANNDEAWVLRATDASAGNGVLAPGTASFDLGFDYVLDSFFASNFRYQYAEVLHDGTSSNIVNTGRRTIIRSGLFNFGMNIGPVISGAQLADVNNYFNSLPSGASVPVPNAIVLMLSAISFLGFTRHYSNISA